MFKKLKDNIATQVNKTNQTLFSSILPTDSILSTRDSNNRTSSIASHDEHENSRSRLDSTSSDISQTTGSSTSYASPPRQFVPPSDIESEYGGDESDHETNNKMQKLLNIYKNKFSQLKSAYDEVEREKDNLKNVLQQQQDTHIKHREALRTKMKQERQAREQTESIYLKEIKLRDSKIEEFTQQLTEHEKFVESLQEEIKLRDSKIQEFSQQFAEHEKLVQSLKGENETLREQNTKRGTLLAECKQKIDAHTEKRNDLVTERDNLLQQLNEKQTIIETMMKNQPAEDISVESLKTNENVDVDRLQEQLESTNIRVQQLEADLELAKQQPIKSNSDEYRQKYEDLLIKFNEISLNNEQILNDKLTFEQSNKEFQESLLKDKQQIEELTTEIAILKNSLSTENETHLRSYEALTTEYKNLRNELDQTAQERTMYKDKYENTDNATDQINTTLSKLEHDYKESLEKCTQLTEKLNTQHQEHLEELAKLNNQQQIELNNKLKELQEENNRIILEKDNQHKKSIEILKMEIVNTEKEQNSEHENEFQNEIKRLQEEIANLSLQINQQKKELEEKSSQITEFEKLKMESTLSQIELIDECNSLKEQNKQLTILQQELDEKKMYIQSIEHQLEEKQNDSTTIEQLKATIKKHEQNIETNQVNNQHLLEQKDKEIDTLKQNLSNQQSLYDSLTKEKQQIVEDLNKQKLIINEIDNIQQQLISQQSQLNEKDEQLSILKTKLDEQQDYNEKYSELETKFNNILSEKAILENELDSTHIQIQTTQSALNEKTNVNMKQTEEKIKELETQCDSYQNEIETLKSEIVSLVNINEENTRRIDEFDDEKFNFEQEIIEKSRQITESNEKIEELESNLKQAQETGAKLRKALQKMKDSITNKEQTNNPDTEIQLQKVTDEYEQRLKEQEKEYNTKLKLMAKEMNVQIEDKELTYNRQLNEYMQRSRKNENDLIHTSEQQVTSAEERALNAEREMSKLQEQLKEKQLEHYRTAQDLQNQIQKLTRQTPETINDATQTSVEDLHQSNGDQHLLIFEPTEVDYLKQIVLAYMTGTDRITMAKVICAVLRYTDNETSLVIEQEKLRQSVSYSNKYYYN
ncbi:unnamed protein product [Adineta steineri]|uniref:GRIP domain-containing protein n=1 Tax=Adineta steineri TaxID=433720 RepID=A0A814QNF0_9BILA|nr:unnamed protein product [Adineta steineri]CAF3708720.1 unnamed protein product [Adineta steineri]